MWIGDGQDLPGSYSEMLRRSKFCLVMPGDGFSARAVDSVSHGCLPVVIQDNVDASFATIVDWEQFGLTVAEKDVGRILRVRGY